jgi:hypothetical protein
MKKITFCVMAMFLSLAFYPLQSNAAATKDVAPTTMVVSAPQESVEYKALLSRLDEIEKMDKSDMKSSEKRVLRKEVRSIKQQLHEMGGYVYVSVGALILIALLLIILL